MLTIGLMWHEYPSENLGVGALTHGHFRLLDEVISEVGLEAQYLVFSNMDGKDTHFSLITKRPVRYLRLSIKDIFKRPASYLAARAAVSSCSVVIDLSAGDSFTDIYGFKRFLQQVLTKYLAITTGSPLILCPQTIGPFDKWYGRLVGNFIISRSRRLFARDRLSYEYLNSGVKRDNTELAADLAFALPFNRGLFQFDKGLTHVGVNVSGLLFNGGYNNKNQFAMKIDYPAFIRSLLTRLLALDRVRLHLVPHVISRQHEVDDDYRVCQLLAQEFPACVLAPRFATPSQAKSYISNLDFFSGARMHSTIAALSSGVPVVPVSYSRKFSGLFGSLGYDCLVDGKENSNDEALAIIMAAFKDRAQLRECMAKGNQLAQERLGKYRDYLYRVIREMGNA